MEVSKDLIVLEISMLEDEYQESSGVYDAWMNFKAILQKLIISMQTFIRKLKTDVDVAFAQMEKNKRFKELKYLINQPGGEKKKIYFLNIEGAVVLYQQYIKKFTKELNHIMKKSFVTFSDKEEKQLSFQIEEFEAELEQFEDELDDTLNERIVKRGNEALDYIKRCRSGVNPVYKYYFDMIRTYENFKAEADKQLRYKVLDTEKELRKRGNLTRIQVAMQKTSNKASKTARKIMYRILWWTV
jgi:hypothetical protein